MACISAYAFTVQSRWISHPERELAYTRLFRVINENSRNPIIWTHDECATLEQVQRIDTNTDDCQMLLAEWRISVSQEHTDMGASKLAQRIA